MITPARIHLLEIIHGLDWKGRKEHQNSIWNDAVME
jgi:hypothetical protein